MKLKLDKYWTEKLLTYPESGMGYQKVDVVLKTGRIIKGVVVLNAEEMVLTDEYKNLRLEEIKDLLFQRK